MSTLQPRSTEIKGITITAAEYAVCSGLETDVGGSAAISRPQSNGSVKDGPLRTFEQPAADGRFEPILWKNSVLLAQKVVP